MIARWGRDNWYWLVIAALFAGLVWQTLRIEGVQIGPD